MGVGSGSAAMSATWPTLSRDRRKACRAAAHWASAPPVQPKSPSYGRKNGLRPSRQRLRALLAEVLGRHPNADCRLHRGKELFGALPELDSLAVANLLNGWKSVGVLIEDHDVEAEDFESFGRLLAFTRRLTCASGRKTLG